MANVRTSRAAVPISGGWIQVKHRLERIDTVLLRVPDLERTVRWYTETLGLKIKWRTDLIATLKAGDGTPITFVPQDAVKEECPFFNFYTSDLREAYEEMKLLGVEVGPIRDYGTVQTFDFRDDSGQLLNVCHF